MTLCLDTAFLIDLLADEASASAFLEAHDGPFVISALCFYELLFASASRRRAEKIEAFSRAYAVLPADYEVCALAAAIQTSLGETGEIIPVVDALIASTAVLAEAEVVTRDEHFFRIPPEFGLGLRPY